MEEKLRNLKEMDNAIDSILSQEFEQRNEVEELEEEVRDLLGKR